MTYLMWKVHKHIRGAQRIDKVYDFAFAVVLDVSVLIVLILIYDFMKG
jgi:hypothetical protein